MLKRELLSFTPDFDDYVITAIHTIIEPHQIAYLFNTHCATSFWRCEQNLEVFVNKKTSSHSCFKHIVSYNSGKFWLITNSGNQGILYKSKPNPDYLLASNSEDSKNLMEEWINIMNKVPAISTAYLLPQSKVSKLEWLVFLNEYSAT